MTWKIQYIYKNLQNSVNISDDCTINQLKTKIITSITNEKIDYIDLKIESDFPIREFGKLTINSGIFPRHWDQRKISNLPNKLSKKPPINGEGVTKPSVSASSNIHLMQDPGYGL